MSAGGTERPLERNEDPSMSTTTYQVSGMTCGHCESSVRSELSALEGVSEVTAKASSGLVTVVSETPLEEEAVRAAVDEAGFELVGPAAS
ncbi:heavy-metal-associated domain-containing protein [Streptomyces sp. JH002]|uniref:heavy-metal-associated domain-containing protein n=1 Tax=Streptomyces sp. JH002 TaxID=2763259 RepID=UPI003D8056D6